MKVDENICTDEQPLFCGGRLNIHDNIWGAHLVAGSEKCSWWDERLQVSWVLLKAGAVKKHLRYCRVQFLFMPWRPPNPKSFTAHSRLRPSLSGQMCKSVSLKKWEKKSSILKNVKQFQIKSMWRRICSAKEDAAQEQRWYIQAYSNDNKIIYSKFIAVTICLFFISKCQRGLKVSSVLVRHWKSEGFSHKVFATALSLLLARKQVLLFLQTSWYKVKVCLKSHRTLKRGSASYSFLCHLFCCQNNELAAWRNEDKKPNNHIQIMQNTQCM